MQATTNEVMAMFTGIVQGVGEIVAKSTVNTVTSMTISLPNVENLAIGASVSINGVCLTAVSIESNNVQFDIIDETIDRELICSLVYTCLGFLLYPVFSTINKLQGKQKRRKKYQQIKFH